MNNAEDIHDAQDPYNLARFTNAQERDYSTALAELKAGQKRSHWVWYVFPQIAGLGRSETSRFYAIASLAEAESYLHHPVLGARLQECAAAILAVKNRSALQIMGSPDDVKLWSCMTLFAHVAGPDSVFVRVLDAYFGGRQDAETLRLLEQAPAGTKSAR